MISGQLNKYSSNSKKSSEVVQLNILDDLSKNSDVEPFKFRSNSLANREAMALRLSNLPASGHIHTENQTNNFGFNQTAGKTTFTKGQNSDMMRELSKALLA